MMFALLGMPEHVLSDCLALVLFGVFVIGLVAFGVKVADWVWGDLDLEKEVQKGNVAAGIVMAAVIVGLCIAMAIVAGHIIG